MVVFELGQVVATPGCLAVLEEAGQTPLEFLRRHSANDWGEDCCREDAAANNSALQDGGRIFSIYRTSAGVKIWVITEAVGSDGKRASSCLLLPGEY